MEYSKLNPVIQKTEMITFKGKKGKPPKTFNKNHIPIVIHHTGDQLYFQNCVRINAVNNTVIIIGNEENSTLFDDLNNVFHVYEDDLLSNDLAEFHTHFVNYSTNGAQYEFKCFVRIYLLREFLKKYPFLRVVFGDSDCIFLTNMDAFYKSLPQINCAYSIIQEHAPHNMSASVHASLLNLIFCDAFVKVCRDIYVNKSKFHVILPKIQWHKKNNVNGGICDMTIYYIIYRYGLVPDIFDTNTPVLYEGEYCVLDHNIMSPYGFDGNQTFPLVNGMKNIHKLVDKEGNAYCITNNKIKVRLLCIHYQGTADKAILNDAKAILNDFNADEVFS